jgi:hypothetical protein
MCATQCGAIWWQNKHPLLAITTTLLRDAAFASLISQPSSYLKPHGGDSVGYQEECVMNFVKYAVAVAVLSAAFGAGASAATLGDCNKMATQVNRALNANATSSSFDAAQKEKQLGSYYCTMDSYQKGVDHYSQALTLLGQK